MKWGLLPGVALLTLCALAWSFSQPLKLRAGANPVEPAATPLADSCAGCHAAAVAAFRETLHGKYFINHPRGALELANCASCHGPLEAHANNPDDPKSIRSLRRERLPDAKLRSAPCLSCHQNDPALFSAAHSRHQKAGVACSDCHSVMRPVSSTHLLPVRDANTLCASCHTGITAQAHLRSTHIAAGAGVGCLDCHNPHGAQRAALKNETVNETCTTCHAAQRGPFLFEHAPVEENCLTCHTPHGATQPALLKMNNGSLCLSCHSQAPFFHKFTGLDRFTLAKACANCHAMIHGSNHADGSRLQR